MCRTTPATSLPALGLAVLFALGAAPAAGAGVTERISLDPAGLEGDGDSLIASVSGNGRFVAFESSAVALVAGDTNFETDIFVRDRKSGVTTRVSVDSAGGEADDASANACLSRSGRFIAFSSAAENLVAGDTNATNDIFVHDRKTGLTTRASVNSAGIEALGTCSDPGASTSGRFIAFTSAADNLVAGDTNDDDDAFVHDRKTGSTTRVSIDSAGVEAEADSFDASLSGSGRFVAFDSFAANLVAGDRNNEGDTFVHDRKKGLTTRVSVDSAGAEGDGASVRAALSANGRFVAFESSATNLVAGDTNGVTDILLHDRTSGVTSRVSVSSAGAESDGDSFDPFVSASGRFVAFESSGATLVADDSGEFFDAFLHDRKP